MAARLLNIFNGSTSLVTHRLEYSALLTEPCMAGLVHCNRGVLCNGMESIDNLMLLRLTQK
jgi:hypothetical protein